LLGHGLQDGVDLVEFLGVLVEGDDVCPAPVRLERVPAQPAADIDHRDTGPDAEPVIVNSQHIARSYIETVCAATDSQLNTSSARCRPAAPRRLRWCGESNSSPRTRVSASTSAGGTSRAHSPSGPSTSGRAPARLATIGVPLAIASTAGSENPS